MTLFRECFEILINMNLKDSKHRLQKSVQKNYIDNYVILFNVKLKNIM